MLEYATSELIREQIAIFCMERDQSIRDERAKLVFEFVRNGTLQSSIAARRTLELFGAELKIRVEMALSAAMDVSTRLRVELIKDELLGLLTAVASEQREHLYSIIHESSPFTSTGRAGKQAYGLDAASYLDDAQGFAIRKAAHNINLALHEAAIRAQDVDATAAISVVGDQNVIVAGNFTRSPVNVSLEASAMQPLVSALDGIQQALAGGIKVEGVDSGELGALIQEAREETTKLKPSKLRLRTIAEGIGGAIRTTAALKPAYDSLKAFLAIFGVSLP